MTTDNAIKEAIAAGEKNQRSLTLIRNWCAHAKVNKSGGVGLIEAQTGLPIGHHSLECPHATSRGMAMRDLEDVAIDFYDRNCRGCKHRKPVGLPNITELVAARDRLKTEETQENERVQKQYAAELAVRNEARSAIRSKLSAVQATILDQLDELDKNPTAERAEQLAETARVAPEHFTPEIQSHLLDLLKVGGYHRTVACLGALDTLDADANAVCSSALKALARHDAVALAASLVLKHVNRVEARLIGEALPALIGHANPRVYPMLGDSRRRPVKEPLQQLFFTHPNEVAAQINKILSLRSADACEVAARGIACIGEVDAAFPLQFVQTLIAKLVRAKHLMPDLNERDHETPGVIRSVIVAAFMYDPEKVDGHLQGYLPGADDEGRAAILHVYDRVLRELRFARDRVPPSEAHKLAFQRLLRATYSANSQEALRTLQEVFSGDLYDLAPLATLAIDDLLGAAALLDDRLKVIPHSLLQDPRPVELIALERQQLRTVLISVQNTCVKWACQAAGLAGSGEVDKVLSFYRGLQEDRERLRSSVIGSLHELARSGDSLNAILPELYGAMVGGSQRLRASAAESYGELAGRRSSDLPNLIHEVFLPLLTDRYVIVHKFAVQALRRFWLPDSLASRAEQALTQLVLAYSQSANDSRFLIECLELLCGRYWKERDFDGSRGDAVIAILSKAKSYEIASHISFWARRLNKHSELPILLVKLIESEELGDHAKQDIIEAIRKLPIPMVLENLSLLEKFGISSAKVHPYHSLAVVELLSDACAWKKSANVARAVYTQIEDTAWNKPSKLDAELRMLATEYEQAIFAGNKSELAAIAQRWKKASDERALHVPLHKQPRDLVGAYSVRIEAVEALLMATGSEPGDSVGLGAVAKRLEAVAELYGDAPTNHTFVAMADLITISGYLREWEAAILTAAPDADRFLRAAKERAKLWVKQHAAESRIEKLREIADSMCKISTTIEAEEAISALSAVPLPVGFFHVEAKRPHHYIPEEDDQPPKPEKLVVAFLEFSIGGCPVSEIQYVPPSVVHDLDITVRVSWWPEKAERLTLKPVSVENPSLYELPSFTLIKPLGDGPYKLPAHGRAVLKLPQAIHARPLEFKYLAEFEPLGVPQPVEVVGQRTLRLEASDWRQHPQTGYPNIDEKIIKIRDELRRLPGIPEPEISDCLKIAI